ncbi:MAG TPA: hybrid sensor histidine kinase/response regulator, partial [bacterium]|nr:hybrid sensor histidine kinase/response regulator [bacterium]
DFIRDVRRSGLELPCILLTGRGDYDLDVEAMHEGAADYLTKDGLDPDKLERVVRYASARARLHVELAKREQLASLGRMAAGLAHEVRNPLMVMQLYTGELMRRFAAEPEALQNLEAISNQIERMQTLMDNTLQLSRNREGRATDIDAAEMMRNCLNLARAQFGSEHKGVNVTLEGPEGFRLRGDRQRLELVFINLIMNAFQAMQGRGRLVLGWEDVEKGSALWVDDSGPGLDEAQLKSLFEPFHTTKAEGTGLGLWLSQTMVQAQGGLMRAFSRPGSGSSFVVWLPKRVA